MLLLAALLRKHLMRIKRLVYWLARCHLVELAGCHAREPLMLNKACWFGWLTAIMLTAVLVNVAMMQMAGPSKPSKLKLHSQSMPLQNCLSSLNPP
jgi:hypothetical protein